MLERDSPDTVSPLVLAHGAQCAIKKTRWEQRAAFAPAAMNALRGPSLIDSITREIVRG